MIYRTIKEAKRRENDMYIANVKYKTRAMWRIINKEFGSNPNREVGEEIRCGTRKGSNLKDIAEMYNSYFTEIIGKLVQQNNGSQAPQEINSCNETMFHVRWGLVPTAWHVLGLRMEKRPPAMEVSCEYIE
jgi:hypothetical protein